MQTLSYDFAVGRTRLLAIAAFLGLSFVVIATAALAAVGGAAGTARLVSALEAATAMLFKAVPVVAAIAMGVAPFRRDLLVRGLLVAGIATAILVALLLSGALPAQTVGLGSLQEVGVGTALRSLVTPGAGPDRIALRYALTDPRVVRVDTLLTLVHLGAPAALVGIACGMIAWTERRVVFRTRTDQWVALLVILALLLPLVYAASTVFVRDAAAAALFRGTSVHRIWITAMPVFLAGALGWASARGRGTVRA